MVAPYTAVDLIRVMDHEMNHRHEDAARRRSWLRRGGDSDGEDGTAVRSDAGAKRVRRPGGIALFSLFNKPAA